MDQIKVLMRELGPDAFYNTLLAMGFFQYIKIIDRRLVLDPPTALHAQAIAYTLVAVRNDQSLLADFQFGFKAKEYIQSYELRQRNKQESKATAKREALPKRKRAVAPAPKQRRRNR